MAAPSKRLAKKRVDGADTTTQTVNRKRKHLTDSGIAQAVPRAVSFTLSLSLSPSLSLSLPSSLPSSPSLPLALLLSLFLSLKGMVKAPSTKKRKVGADVSKKTAKKRHGKPTAKEKEEVDDWNAAEGFVWNEDELCTECLQVLEEGSGVHLGLAAPDPGTRTEPVGGPLEVGDEVMFDMGEDIVTGMLMRKQTFYQVAVAGADPGVVETYHTISVEQHEIRKAPPTSSSGPEVEKHLTNDAAPKNDEDASASPQAEPIEGKDEDKDENGADASQCF
jgi:hypothetical protein